MRCEEVESLLSDYLNGALVPSEADAVETHLADCPDCQQVLAELRWLAGMLRGVPAVAMPVDLGARISAALSALPDEAPGASSGNLRIPCDEAEDYMSGHLEQDLDEWEALALTSHLEGCAPCQLSYRQLEATRSLLRAVPREAMPAGLDQRIFAALEALPVAGTLEACEETREQLSEHLEGRLGATEVAIVDEHLASCADCRQQRTQLEAVRALLRAVPREPLPAGLAERISAAVAALPEVASVVDLKTAPRSRKRASLLSAFGGAVAAGLLFFVWNMQSQQLPHIETAAISTNTDVAVNIGFDVAQSVEGVNFQIDLPEGLKFVDEKSKLMLGQSVAWRGSLQQGKTLVPVVVRGMRPGRYEIQAYVSKGAMRKQTTIVLPVSGG